MAARKSETDELPEVKASREKVAAKLKAFETICTTLETLELRDRRQVMHAVAVFLGVENRED